MGRSGLVSHGKGPKHLAKLEEILKTSTLSIYFNKPSTSKATATASLSANLTEFVQTTNHVQNAEIKCALKVVDARLPFRSCVGINSLFQSMFPDSKIAQTFQMGKTKCSYFISFGLAPHFKLELEYQILKYIFRKHQFFLYMQG